MRNAAEKLHFALLALHTGQTVDRYAVCRAAAAYPALSAWVDAELGAVFDEEGLAAEVARLAAQKLEELITEIEGDDGQSDQVKSSQVEVLRCKREAWSALRPRVSLQDIVLPSGEPAGSPEAGCQELRRHWQGVVSERVVDTAH